MTDPVALNQRRSRILIASIGVVPVVLGVVLDLAAGLLPILTVVGVVVAVAVGYLLVSKADSWVLRSTGAIQADPERYQRLHNLVEGLCLANGIPKPTIFVVTDAAPNCFSVGRSARQATLVVTDALVDSLNRVELEGVVAHELVHIRQHDTQFNAVAALVLGSPLRVLGPVLRWLVGRLEGDHRESLVDLAACQMTRYPPGLLGALEHIDSIGSPTRAATPATSHLWLAPVAFTNDVADGRHSGHAVMNERMALLREL